MKPEISEEIISGWRSESHEAMSERLAKHKEAGDHIGYHAWKEVDAQNAYYEGYVDAKASSHERILELEKEVSNSNGLLLERLQANVELFRKLTKRDELLKRCKFWIGVAKDTLPLKHFDKITEWQIEVEQLEQEK